MCTLLSDVAPKCVPTPNRPKIASAFWPKILSSTTKFLSTGRSLAFARQPFLPLDWSQYLLLFPSYSRWSAGDCFFFWKLLTGPTLGICLLFVNSPALFDCFNDNIFSHSPSGLLCAFWLLLQSESHHCLNSDQRSSKPCTVYHMRW